MPTAVSLANASVVPVFVAQPPCEGPVTFTLFLDFTAATSYVLDGKPFTDRGTMSMVQTLFVDSTGCTTNLIIDVDRTAQRITILPNRQGFYPVLAPNPFRFTFTCSTGPAGVRIILLNAPIAPGQWATA